MTRSIEFSAPWSTSLKVSTLLVGGFLLSMAFGAILFKDSLAHVAAAILVVTPLLILALTWPFAVRGYVVEKGRLVVRRPFWNTKIELAGLASATVDPHAADRSLRLCGDGGLFCYCGLFRNKALGNYSLYATDFARAVVLKLPHRPVVVTPGDPNKFVAAIEEASAQPVRS